MDIYLRLTLLAYVVVFLHVVFGVIFGVPVFFGKDSKMLGDVMFYVLLLYSVWFPILPLAVIFQLVHFFARKEKAQKVGHAIFAIVNLYPYIFLLCVQIADQSASFYISGGGEPWALVNVLISSAYLAIYIWWMRIKGYKNKTS